MYFFTYACEKPEAIGIKEKISIWFLVKSWLKINKITEQKNKIKIRKSFFWTFVLNLFLESLKAISIIGIKEIDEYINNKISNKTILKDRIIFRTMRYVKRQLTWSRGNMQEWKKLKSSDFERFFNL